MTLFEFIVELNTCFSFLSEEQDEISRIIDSIQMQLTRTRITAKPIKLQVAWSLDVTESFESYVGEGALEEETEEERAAKRVAVRFLRELHANGLISKVPDGAVSTGVQTEVMALGP